MTQVSKDRKEKKRQCKPMQGFESEVYDCNAKERARYSRKGAFFTTKKRNQKEEGVFHTKL